MATHRTADPLLPSPSPSPQRRTMAEIRIRCELDIQAQRQRATAAASGLRRSLHSISSLAQQTLENREKLVNVKDELRELGTELGKTLAVKTGKEAKFTSLSEALSSASARKEHLKKLVLEQRRKRDGCAAVISEQLSFLEKSEEKSQCFIAERKKIEEAINWYKRILGFQAEGGEGVKFIFQKVDMKNPEEEFKFVVRFDNDVYKLLHSDPVLETSSGLVQELNKTNDLFKFVRNMRKEFKNAVLSGILPPTSSCPERSLVTVSSPPSLSVDSRIEVSATECGISTQLEGQQFVFPKLNKAIEAIKNSPQSVTGMRRSPRLLR